MIAANRWVLDGELNEWMVACVTCCSRIIFTVRKILAPGENARECELGEGG